MYSRILYPTDFSNEATRAFNHVKKLKEAGAQEVILLHVIDRRDFYSFEHYGAMKRMVEMDVVDQMLEKEILKQMEPIEEELTKLGFVIKKRIEKGIPFREILKVEKDENVSVIVIGSHGKTNIIEMLLGSTAEKVLRKASKPIILVKREG
jgi:nucleotide-binding universal stress UspA family protein